jgi:hypothetical protein
MRKVGQGLALWQPSMVEMCLCPLHALLRFFISCISDVSLLWNRNNLVCPYL